MMPKNKTKFIRKTKKKPARPAKRTRRKASSRKKKLLRKQSQTVAVLAVEVAEVVVMGDVEQDSVDETQADLRDPLDEHFPPDFGGSE
jgi:hypothetical protein